MSKGKLSYAEAYTAFIKYYSKRKSIDFDILVTEFRDKGIEQDFIITYNSSNKLSNAEYYKKIKE